MIVEKTGSGKTVTWRTLQNALSTLHRNGEPGFNLIQFKTTLAGIRAYPDLPTEQRWTSVVRQIHITAAETLGKTKPGKRYLDKQVWFWTNVVQESISKKKRAYKRWRVTRLDADRPEYRMWKSDSTRTACGSAAPRPVAIYALRLLVEQHREKNKTVHLAFLDMEKAFAHIPHDLIWSHGVPEPYVDLVKMLYHRTTSVIRCAVGTSPPFDICVGIHQGSARLPLLFITCMDDDGGSDPTTTPLDIAVR
ncbi:hypothetical protein cypCar_00000646 [Cyprinus carpio]|nr:hypothetical protein cypCar_00000646 [Cyprinus carpio]